MSGFHDRILALYARGMSVRDIQGDLQEMYGVEMSPDLISRVTSAVADDVTVGGTARATRSIIDGHQDPPPIGEERGQAIGAVHHSPVKIWARVAGSA